MSVTRCEMSSVMFVFSRPMSEVRFILLYRLGTSDAGVEMISVLNREKLQKNLLACIESERIAVFIMCFDTFLAN